MSDHIEKIDHAQALSAHRFRYYDFAMAATCVIIVCANIIGAGKVAAINGFTFGAGVLFFPLSYVLGDVMTEVYGYARARRVDKNPHLLAHHRLTDVILQPFRPNRPIHDDIFGSRLGTNDARAVAHDQEIATDLSAARMISSLSIPSLGTARTMRLASAGL